MEITKEMIHNCAWVVLIFTLGVLVGYLWKMALVYREWKKNQGE